MIEQDFFCQLVKAEVGVVVVKEFKFHPTRKWRFDYSLPTHKIAIEVDGAIWNYGRHNRPQGYIKDMEKLNAAASLGWLVFRITPQQQNESYILDLLKQTITLRENENTI